MVSPSALQKTVALSLGFVLSFVNVGPCLAGTGDIEAGLQIGPALHLDSGHGSGDCVLLQRLAYYPTDAWQVGMTFGPLGDFDSSPSSIVTLLVNRDVELLSDVTAFVGVHVGARIRLLQGDPEATEVLGPHVGSRIHLTGHWFLTGEFRYDPSLRNSDSSNLSMLVGFSFLDQVRWIQSNGE